MTLAMMTDGVSRVVQLAQEIDSAAGEQRIKFIDIGSYSIVCWWWTRNNYIFHDFW